MSLAGELDLRLISGGKVGWFVRVEDVKGYRVIEEERGEFFLGKYGDF